MNHRFLVSTILTCVVSFAVVVNAGMPFDDAVAEIIDNNLSRRADDARSRASVENSRADNTLAPLDAEFTRLWGKSENKWSLSVSQSFDWPGIYAARKAAAGKEEIASRYLLESKVFELRTQARSVLVDLIHNAKLIEMSEDLVARVSMLEEKCRKGVETADVTRLDYNKAAIELIMVRQELETLRAERVSLIAELTALNGGRDVQPMVAAVGSDYPALPSVTAEMVSSGVIAERDPQYAAAKAAADAARAQARVARMSSLPGFSVGYEHELEGEDHFNGFSVSLSLPVWGKRRQVKAAALDSEAALLDAEMEMVKISAALSADLKKLESLRRLLDAYEPVVNNDSNSRLLQKAFDAGQINFITFIEETNYFHEARKEYLNTLYEYNRTLVSLTRYE